MGPSGGDGIMWALTSSVGFWEGVETTERRIALEEFGGWGCSGGAILSLGPSSFSLCFLAAMSRATFLYHVLQPGQRTMY